MLFVLNIVQVTFVKQHIVDLPTTGFTSQGMGTQAKTSNVTNQAHAYPNPTNVTNKQTNEAHAYPVPALG